VFLRQVTVPVDIDDLNCRVFLSDAVQQTLHFAARLTPRSDEAGHDVPLVRDQQLPAAREVRRRDR
jgi:hypothetical protein